jgi:hypothetical protein
MNNEKHCEIIMKDDKNNEDEFQEIEQVKYRRIMLR